MIYVMWIIIRIDMVINYWILNYFVVLFFIDIENDVGEIYNLEIIVLNVINEKIGIVGQIIDILEEIKYEDVEDVKILEEMLLKVIIEQKNIELIRDILEERQEINIIREYKNIDDSQIVDILNEI